MLRTALPLLIALASTTISAQEPMPLPATVADVVVVRAPGPAPWKITKDGHVAWIFSYPGVVPEALDWESARLERALTRSQEFLGMPQLDLGFRVRRAPLTNPDGKRLADVLPADVYADYLRLKAELFPDSDALEDLQPNVAGSSLLAALNRRSGLKEGTQILNRIEKLARAQRGLRRTRIEIRPSRAERAQLRTWYTANLTGIPQEREIQCFASAMANVRNDMEVLQERAKLWAEGFLQELKGLQTSREREDYCSVRVPESAERQILERLYSELWERWYAALDAALSRNESTVAVLDVGVLVDAESYFQKGLRERGYSVDVP